MKIFAEKGEWVPKKVRWKFVTLFIGGGCLLFSRANLADETPLPPEQGYMLIRVSLNQGERVGTLAMTSVETNQVVRCRTNSFKPTRI